MEYVADLEVEGFGQLRVVACLCQLALRTNGGVYGPSSGTDVVRISLQAPEGEPSSESMLTAARDAVRSPSLRVAGMAPKSAWVSSATFSFEPNEKLTCGEICAEVRLPKLIPFPFEPGQVASSRPGDPTFEEALLNAFRAARIPCVAAKIVETDRYWMMPVRQIGLLGTIVDRRSGKVTLMDSGQPREVWLWAWEQGLTEEGSPLVLEYCENPALLHQRLRHLYRLEAADYERLPLTLPYDWRAFGPLFASRDLVRLRAHRPG